MSNVVPALSPVIGIYWAAALLAPGIVILFVRSMFAVGARIPPSAMLWHYMVVSVVYYALVLPIMPFISAAEDSEWKTALAWAGLTVAGPALLGLLLGVVSQKEFIYKAFRRIGLNPVHRILTAWDWKFGAMGDEWVLITLKDGTRIGGLCGRDSFVSSNPDERDLYIESIYRVDGDDRYSTRDERRGVWIASGEISTIEFWPYNSEGVVDHAE